MTDERGAWCCGSMDAVRTRVVGEEERSAATAHSLWSRPQHRTPTADVGDPLRVEPASPGLSEHGRPSLIVGRYPAEVALNGANSNFSWRVQTAQDHPGDPQLLPRLSEPSARKSVIATRAEQRPIRVVAVEGIHS